MKQDEVLVDHAAYCERGHVISLSVRALSALQAPGSHCPQCGSAVITACTNCGAKIPGRVWVQERGYGPPTTTDPVRPDFCAECGTPFPWIGRVGRIYKLMNMLDDEDLEDAEKLKAHEALEALLSADLDEQAEATWWERFRARAPRLWNSSGGKKIFETVATEYVKKQLDLS